MEAKLIGNPPYGLGVNGLNPDLSHLNGAVLEMMGTLILCLTVVMTAVHKKALSQGTPNLAPLAIGLSVFLAHVVLVPLTGCGINPARTFGPAFVNLWAGNVVWTSSYWIYFGGPLMGACIAAALYSLFKSDDEEEGTEDVSSLEEPIVKIDDDTLPSSIKRRAPRRMPSTDTAETDTDIENLREEINRYTGRTSLRSHESSSS